MGPILGLITVRSATADFQPRLRHLAMAKTDFFDVCGTVD